MRNTKTTQKTLVKDNIIGKRVFSFQIVDTPAHPMFFIPNKDCSKPFGTSLATKFIRYGHIAVAPPDMKMGQVGLVAVSYNLKRHNIHR
jgi:hypothetical protein